MNQSRHQPKIFGLTGSIGSGKSEVARILEQMGAEVIDADTLSRQVVQPGTPALAEIVDSFGSEYLLPSGELDRKKLGALVFSDKEKLRILEEIVHPRVQALFHERSRAFRESSSKQTEIVIYAVPLLFESGLNYDFLDGVIVVSAPEELCIERVCRRDGLSPERAEQILASQLPSEDKKSKADYVIENSQDLKHLTMLVRDLWPKLLA